jgi:hypothetical protein
VSSVLTTASLGHAIGSLRPVVSQSVAVLDPLDMVLGDGDMGGTLELTSGRSMRIRQSCRTTSAPPFKSSRWRSRAPLARASAAAS